MFSSMAAGRSAIRRSRQLRWSASPVRLHGLDFIFCTLGALLALSAAVNFWTLFLPIGVFAWRVHSVRTKKAEWIKETRVEAKRYRIGGKAEGKTARSHALRFTARQLITLGRFACHVLFDRKVPGSAANVDELAIGKWGVANVDSKSRKGHWVDEGGYVTYNGRHLDTRTTEWECEKLAEVLDEHFGPGVIPVISIWALQNTRQLPFTARMFGGTLVLPAKLVPSTLAKQPARITRRQIKQVTRLIASEFKKA